MWMSDIAKVLPTAWSGIGQAHTAPESTARRPGRRMWHTVVVALLLTLSLPSPGAAAWENPDVQAMLRGPGVKLVAVDFYAKWCSTCNAAIPKWKALQEKYRSRGVRLIVVSVKSEGSFTDPGWAPDGIVRDDDGIVQEQWGVSVLPQAFLWSWQGQLLASHATVDQVEERIEEYFRTAPRIAVAAPRTSRGSKAKDAEALRGLVQSELSRSARFDLVASPEELSRLLEKLAASQRDLYDEKEGCPVGKALPPNSVMQVFVDREGRPSGRLGLKLLSGETGCLLASSHAPLGSGDVAAVAEAVEKLLRQMVEEITLPGRQMAPAVRPPLQAGKGHLVLSSTPPGATVWLGSTKLGRTSAQGLSVSLDQGRHRLRFQLAGHSDKLAEAEVVVGEDRAVRVALLSSAEAARGGLDGSGQQGVVAVRSTPKRARILIDGQDTGKLTDSNLAMRPGRYVLQLVKDLYVPGREQVLDVKAAEMLVHTETLTPNFGALHVTSRPAGAEVLINGHIAGKTPLRRPQQTAGRLQITLRYPMHLDVKREVELANGGELELSETLSPAYGTLRVATEPTGAEVVLDGRLAGHSPMALREVPLGRRHLMLRLELHESVEATIDVKPGGARSLRYVLKPAYGLLTVPEASQSSKVWLDDQELGPPKTYRVAPGPHAVEVRPSDDRYQPHRESVAVAKGGQVTVDARFAPRVGGVLVATEPAGAVIYLDGQVQGGNPVKLEALLVGRHHLRAEKDGFSPAERSVEITEGRRKTVILRLSTKANLRVVSLPEGAQVVVDGKRRGAAPTVVGGLEGGKHLVRCLLPGYVPWAAVAMVQEGSESQLKCRLESNAEAARRVEAAKRAEARRRAEMAKRAEAARRAETKRRAEAERRAEATRRAEAARRAQAARAELAERRRVKAERQTEEALAERRTGDVFAAVYFGGAFLGRAVVLEGNHFYHLGAFWPIGFGFDAGYFRMQAVIPVIGLISASNTKGGTSFNSPMLELQIRPNPTSHIRLDLELEYFNNIWEEENKEAILFSNSAHIVLEFFRSTKSGRPAFEIGAGALLSYGEEDWLQGEDTASGDDDIPMHFEQISAMAGGKAHFRWPIIDKEKQRVHFELGVGFYKGEGAYSVMWKLGFLGLGGSK